MDSTSCTAPERYETNVVATRAVRSSIAAANASGCGSTWTTSAPRSSCACAICPLDPVLPLRPVLVPAVEVLLVGGADGVGERALRARVDVDALAEDRKPPSN